MELASFLSQEQIQELGVVISKAELLTSGEIRQARAVEVFEALGMEQTNLHNGVLIYISYEDQKFAICGDKGIHKNLSKRFWTSLGNGLRRALKNQDYFKGISNTIMECGRQLRVHFPYQHDDINELENHVTFEDDLT